MAGYAPDDELVGTEYADDATTKRVEVHWYQVDVLVLMFWIWMAFMGFAAGAIIGRFFV